MLAILWIAATAAVLLAAWLVCAAGEYSLSLGFLKPFTDVLVRGGMTYAAHPRSSVETAALVASLSLAFPSLVLRRKGGAFFAGLAFAAAGEALLILGRFQQSSFLFLAAAGFFLLVNHSGEQSLGGSDEPLGREELWILFGITLLGIYFRAYALNQVPDTFEGELAPYAAGSTALAGIPAANRGMNGPWAPLGLLYYLPIYLSTSLFGTTIVALRTSSMLVGALTIPLMYLAVRKLFGRSAAFFAAALFSLNSLHIGWSRTDVHPHGVTTWPTLLLCICLLNAARTGAWRWGAALALSMGLTWHQYPSGQSAVMIPFIALSAHAAVNRFRISWPKALIPWILLGAVLWFLGLPASYYLADGSWQWLNPFTLTTQRTSWGNTNESMGIFTAVGFILQSAWTHLSDVMSGMFFRAPYLFHQDFVPEIPGLPVRTVPWLLITFILGGFYLVLCRIRTLEACILLGWMIAALFPGIFSERAYPKRLSTFFPALDVLAALSIAYSFSLVREHGLLRRFMVLAATGGALCFTMFTGYAWFSGLQWHYGAPYEVKVARELESFLGPRTIIVADLWKDYDEGKFTYLLMDDLTDPKNRPNVWYLTRSDVEPIEDFIADPRAAVRALGRNPNRWFYRWTRLGAQYAESVSTTDWDRVVYIFQDRPLQDRPHTSLLEDVIRRCPSPRRLRIETKGTFVNAFEVVSCPLSRPRSNS